MSSFDGFDGTLYHPSPPSSDGVVESIDGTPNTTLTEFSPHDARTVKTTTVHSGDVPLRSSLPDPFISSSTQQRGGLSAKALAFQPSFEMRSAPALSPAIAIGSGQEAQIPNPSDYLEKLAGAEALSSTPKPSSATHFGTFTTDSHISRVIKVTGKHAVATFLPYIEASKKTLRDRGMAKRGSERAEDMGNSHYLRLSNVRDAMELYNGIKEDNPGLIVEYSSPVSFGQLFSPGGRYSAHEGQVLLTVNYASDSGPDKKLLEESLIEMLQVEGKLYAWQKLSATPTGTFRMFAEYEDASYASGAVTRSRKVNDSYKLQNITVSVDLHRPDIVEPAQSQQFSPIATPTRRSGDQSDLNGAFGSMSLNHSISSASSMGSPLSIVPAGASMHYLAAASGLPLSNNHPLVMGGLGSLYVPPGVNAFQQAYAPSVLSPQGNSGLGEHTYSTIGASPYPLGGFQQHSFGMQSTDFQQPQFGNGFNNYDKQSPNQDRDLGQYNRAGGRRPYVARVHHGRGHQHSNPANSHHNHVDVTRIRQGIDVRTTVMLRNIPNKVDQAMLKEIVDESSFGRYDFMYLRIDFSNNCNVGYAFINFTDPLDIVDFVVARSNQKWHRFKSDKVAEVSYATIQGKDCLVQKFRNSSVMLEPPHYRPKLFKTIHDPMGRAGEEERFPDSDNASKLKRSCENAEHVGLFAPSAGQHLRDEQRRRRSQYDRGTSLAEREEYGYEDSLYSPLGFSSY